MAMVAPFIPLIIGLAGTAGGAYANIQAAKMNSKAMEAEASSIDETTKMQETQQRRVNALYLGKANATAAASGLDMSSGSPLLMELDRVKQTELEAYNVRRGGALQAMSARFGAKMQRQAIPGYIFRGAAEGGSIFSKMAGSRYGTSTYTI
jgi:hypothetical protein